MEFPCPPHLAPDRRLAGSLAVIFPFDAGISAWVRQAAPENSWALRIMKVARYPFSIPVFVALGAALLVDPVSKRLAWDLRRRRQFVGFAVALAACFGTTHAVKFLVGRSRPHQNQPRVDSRTPTVNDGATSQSSPVSDPRTSDGRMGDGNPYHFDLFGDPNLRHDSLPSAHTVQFVLLATLLGLYFPRSVWVMVPLAIPACLSRVAQGQHFLTDVIAGAGLTMLIVSICVAVLGREFYPRLWARETASVPSASQK
jgi:membrane-associated phospholipid phosphatase